MVRDTESGMEDPAHCIINEFRFREGLVAAFVCDNPETGSYKAGCIAVQRPQSIVSQCLYSGLRELHSKFWEVLGLDILGRLVNDGKEEKVPYDVNGRPES